MDDVIWNLLGNIKGEKGEDGSNFKILGYYVTLDDLLIAIPTPEHGDAYGIGSTYPYDIYIYDPKKGWVNNGSIQGAKGDKGDKGEKGEPGATGPQGEKGDTGPQGIQGIQGIQGEKGDTGATGEKGDKGDKGDDGVNATITGATASSDNTHSDTPSVTVTSGGTETARSFHFSFFGLKGARGEKGDKGDSGTNGTNGTNATIKEATAEVDSSTGTPSVVVTTGGYEQERKFHFAFKGLKGEKGEKGEDGADGRDGSDATVDINNETPTYSDTTTLATLTSGEKISTAFAKIKYAISNLISHLADTTRHITAAERTAWGAKAPTSHATSATTYGVGTSSNYGHLKITDAVNSTATDTAASAKAIKTVSDMVSGLTTSGAKIKVGSYVGNGKFGADNPNVLTFDFAPKLIMFIGVYSECSVTFAHPSCSKFKTATDGVSLITFNGNTVSWYNKGEYDGGSVTSTERWAEWQANVNGKTYHYIAIG